MVIHKRASSDIHIRPGKTYFPLEFFPDVPAHLSDVQGVHGRVEVIPGGLVPENGGVPKTSLINVFNRNVHGVGNVSLPFIAGHYASMLICLGEIQRIVYGDVMLT